MFFDRFTILCNEKGVKPSKVAIDCGFNKSSITSWKTKYQEGVDVKPTSDIIQKLSVYFDVSTDYLLGNSDDKRPNKPTVTESDIKVALFGGSDDVTQEMWEEVKNYAAYIKSRGNQE